MVGDMSCVCPLPMARFYVWCRFPSHFETPKGVSVWLATFVRCRWHLFLANRPLYAAYYILFANYLCLLPLASSLLTTPICCRWYHSFHETKQLNHACAAAA